MQNTKGKKKGVIRQKKGRSLTYASSAKNASLLSVRRGEIVTPASSRPRMFLERKTNLKKWISVPSLAIFCLYLVCLVYVLIFYDNRRLITNVAAAASGNNQEPEEEIISERGVVLCAFDDTSLRFAWNQVYKYASIFFSLYLILYLILPHDGLN